MRSKLLGAVILSLIILCFTTAAFAQYESNDRSRIGIGFAYYHPSSNELQRVSDSWFAPVVDINLKFDQYDHPEIVLTGGWFGESIDYDTKASIAPITATYIKRFNENENGCWYIGGGLGGYITKYEVYGYTGSYYDWERDHSVKLGAHFIVGREFRSWYFNFRYDKIDTMDTQTGSVDFSGFSCILGSRYTF